MTKKLKNKTDTKLSKEKEKNKADTKLSKEKRKKQNRYFFYNKKGKNRTGTKLP